MWNFIFWAFLSFSVCAYATDSEELKLGYECESHEDCEEIDNAICNSNDVCECADEFLASPKGDSCLPLAKKVGDRCTIPEQCSKISNAECVGNFCVVAQALTLPPLVTKLGDKCTEDSQCLHINGVCENGTCVIPVIAPKTLLLDPMIGMPCSNDSNCKLNNATCVDKICRCKEDYVPAQNLKSCLLKAKSAGDNCSEMAQCISVAGSICENGKCTQKIPKMFKMGAIGSTCQTNDECKHISNALCLEHVCQCNENYVTSVLSNACLLKAKKEGDACEIDKQCEDIKGSFCSKNKCLKVAIADTTLDKIGRKNSGSTVGISHIAAIITIINVCFV